MMHKRVERKRPASPNGTSSTGAPSSSSNAGVVVVSVDKSNKKRTATTESTKDTAATTKDVKTQIPTENNANNSNNPDEVAKTNDPSNSSSQLYDYVQYFGRTRTLITKEREQTRADLERHYDCVLGRVDACQSSFVNDATRRQLAPSLAAISHQFRQYRERLHELRDSFDAEAARIQSSHHADLDFVRKAKRIRAFYADLGGRVRQIERRAVEELIGRYAVTYRPAEKPVDYQLLAGQLVYPIVAPLQLDSLIVSSADAQQALLAVCKFAENKAHFSLVYRATRDGFAAADFHAHCDHRTNTLLVVKSTAGCVFGGFAHATWNHQQAQLQQQDEQTPPAAVDLSMSTMSTGGGSASAVGAGSCFKRDPEAFLFSLVNKEGREPTVFKCQDAARAIIAESRSGASFGTGRDLHICNAADVSARSFANIGRAYRFDLYAHGSEQARHFLAGADYFLASEIECFHVRPLAANDAS